MNPERAERLRVIAIEMDSIAKDIGPKWIRLAHLRQEAQQIIAAVESKEGADERR